MNEENKDTDITPEEMAKVHKALQDEKFRELFFDYCKEISDPENRAKYEFEISQLEKERGFDVTFVKPEAGHVIKSIDQTQNKKVFINVCTSTNAAKADTDGGNQQKGSATGENWTVPHIINKPREDTDKAGKPSIVCDVIFHPDIYNKAKKEPNLMKMLNSIALDSVQEKFGFDIDRNNVKYPKLKFKGRHEASVIRNKTTQGPIKDDKSIFVKYPEPEGDGFNAKTELKAKETKKTPKKGDEMSDKGDVEKSCRTKPRYKIIHRGHFDLQNFTLARDSVASTRPAELCLQIELPMASSAAGIDLDVFEKRVILDSKKPNYYLDLALPYPVDEEKGRAQFDKSRKALILVLPVLAPKAEEFSPDVNLSKENSCDCGGKLTNNSSETHYPEDILAKYLNESTGCQSERGKVDAEGQDIFRATENSNCVDLKEDVSCEAFKEDLHCKLLNGHGKIVANNSCSLEDSVKKESRIAYNDCGFSDENSQCEASSSVKRSEEYGLVVGKEIAEGDIYLDSCNQQVRPATIDSLSKLTSCSAEEHGSCSTKNQIATEKLPCFANDKRLETNNNSPSSKQASGFQELSGTSISKSDEFLIKESSQNLAIVDFDINPTNSEQKDFTPRNADIVNQQVKAISEFDETPTTGKETNVSPRQNINSSSEVLSTLGSFSLEFGNLPDIAGMFKLPPYNYDQDEEKITVNINVSKVKMENVSLGFSSRKVYFSAMTEASEDAERTRWCLVMKFLEYCHLDSDLCSIDVEEDRVVLVLQKAEDSFGLWNKFYAGSSEKALEELFFLTDHSMSELFERIRDKNDPWVQKKSEQIDPELEKEQSEFATKQLEANLEQLLRDQGMLNSYKRDVSEEEGRDTGSLTFVDPSMTENCQLQVQENYSGKSPTESRQLETKLSQSGSETDGAARLSSSSDIGLEICLEELQDDVIAEPDSPGSLGDQSKAPVELSCSEETPSASELRSILKRSTSESTNEESDASHSEDYGSTSVPEVASVRVRSQSFNVDTRPLPKEKAFIARHRNKSVSFDLEPKVCEFIEYSKKQLKKMRKQERKQTEIAAKKSEALAKHAKSTHNKHGKHHNKGGRNKNFFNGLRKDIVCGEDICEPPMRSSGPRPESKGKEKHTETKPNSGEKPGREENTGSTTVHSSGEKPKHASIKPETKKQKPDKTGQNRTSKINKTEVNDKSDNLNGKLINSLIYELDC